jgi:hypothetical protein
MEAQGVSSKENRPRTIARDGAAESFLNAAPRA